MTYLEAIKEELQPYPIRTSLISWKCEKFGINTSDDATDFKVIALVCIDLLFQMKTLNNVAEAGVTLSFDTKNVDDAILRYSAEAGIDGSMYVSKPTVRYLGDL